MDPLDECGFVPSQNCLWPEPCDKIAPKSFSCHPVPVVGVVEGVGVHLAFVVVRLVGRLRGALR